MKFVKEMQSIPVYKVCIIGESGVGKTALCSILANENMLEEHIPTLGVELVPIVVETNKGKIVLNLWDCAGHKSFGGLRDGYWIDAHCMVVCGIASDLDTIQNYSNLSREKQPNAPIVYCCTMSDIQGVRKSRFINISNVQRTGHKELLTSIIRSIMGDHEIQLV